VTYQSQKDYPAKLRRINTLILKEQNILFSLPTTFFFLL